MGEKSVKLCQSRDARPKIPIMRTCNNIEVTVVPRLYSRRNKMRFSMPVATSKVVDNVLLAATLAFGLTKNELVSNTNEHRISRPRMCVTHLIRTETTSHRIRKVWGAIPLKEISRIFNKSDHTFAIYNSRCVTNAIDGYDPTLLEMWERLKREYDRISEVSNG